jgi:hypothetical protein
MMLRNMANVSFATRKDLWEWNVAAVGRTAAGVTSNK